MPPNDFDSTPDVDTLIDWDALIQAGISLATYDTTTLLGGYNQLITDWMKGDDRIFFGDTQKSENPPPPSDSNLTDAYFTLKRRTTDTDANSILQLHVNQTNSPAGVIIAGLNGALSTIIIHIFSASYQQFVNAGTTYYWDIRAFTAQGVTLTIAQGRVQFVQNVTQADVAGVPAALSHSGLPSFKGFSFGPPNGGGPFNSGDWYVNRNGFPGDPFGWYFTFDGYWVAIGVLGDVTGTTQPPALPPTMVPMIPPRFLGFIGGPPTSGGPFYVGDFCRNMNPQPDSPSGWVCIAEGSPGTWVTDGIVGETP